MRTLPLWLLASGCTLEPARPEPPPSPPAAKVVVDDEQVRYRVALADHRIDIEAIFPADSGSDLQLATWTPGSYLIREYARNVEAISASTPDGAPLAIQKTRKNRWQVDTDGAFVVRYRLHAGILSVRENFSDDELVVINGAPTFLTTPARKPAPHGVELSLPEQWQAHTALPAVGPAHWVAENFDVLVDSPIVASRTHQVHHFDAGKVRHHLVTVGDAPRFDQAKVAADLERVTREQMAMWGRAPYPEYWFLNVLAETRGGLEHTASTLMMTSAMKTDLREDRVSWLGLASHELFHAWNVKKLHPSALGALDYESERYTRDLWVVEGVTSYYDDLALVRAGVIDEAEYLGLLSKHITNLQTTPGRAVQPLSEASFDAWIKYYRKHPYSPNSTISYYTKGAVVAFLLDARIQQASGGRASLDDVMTEAWRRWPNGYDSDAFRALASELAGEDLSGFFATAVDGTDELDYAPALAWYGLGFEGAKAEDEPDKDPPAGWFGGTTAAQQGRIVITRVDPDTPGMRAGLAVGDEIIAIDGYRVPSGSLGERLRHHPSGTEARFTIARRGKLRDLAVTLAEAPEESWQLKPSETALPRAVRRRNSWLASRQRGAP